MNRLVAALVLVLCPSSIRAQSEPVPDTLDWRRYFPLELGNEWHYETDDFGTLGYSRWFVAGDTVMDGTHYFALEVSGYDGHRQIQATNVWYIRYDTMHANVLVRSYFADGTPIDDWLQQIPCGLDAPFDVRSECRGIRTGMAFWVFGDHNARYRIGPDSVEVAVRKHFSSLGGDFILLSDMGLVWHGVEGGGIFTNLTYARVGDRQYGTSELPTPIREPPVLPDASEIVAVYPNPFSAEATITYRLASSGAVALEVYDVLGRLVSKVDEGHRAAGEHRLTLTGMGLNVGTYFVRLASASGRQDVYAVTLID